MSSKIYVEFTDAPGVRHPVTDVLCSDCVDTPGNRAAVEEDLKSRGCVGIEFSKPKFCLRDQVNFVRAHGYIIDRAEQA